MNRHPAQHQPTGSVLPATLVRKTFLKRRPSRENQVFTGYIQLATSHTEASCDACPTDTRQVDNRCDRKYYLTSEAKTYYGPVYSNIASNSSLFHALSFSGCNRALGWYQDELAQTECKECSEGSYLLLEGVEQASRTQALFSIPLIRSFCK